MVAALAVVVAAAVVVVVVAAAVVAAVAFGSRACRVAPVSLPLVVVDPPPW